MVETFHSEVLIASETGVDVVILKIVNSEQQFGSEIDLTQLTDNEF